VQCRHFHLCGGCSLPDTPYSEQLDRKRARLADLLHLDVPPLIPSPRQTGFRSKVAFTFATASSGGALVMGHYAAGSNRVIPVEECPVHSGRGNRVAFALRDHLARAGVRAADAPRGVLRHLIVRTSEDEREAVAMLIVTRNDRSLRAPVRTLLESADRPEGFFLNVHAKPGPFMIGPETLRIDGRSHVRETGLGGDGAMPPFAFLVSPTAFCQTNVGAARELVKVVTTAAGSGARMLDLYCGSGLFTLPLAAAGAVVVAVEESRQAIADLKANIRLNRVRADRIRPICGRVEEVLRRLRERWDVVVLDPPRGGCPAAVLATVFERIAPPRAIYVSCNPEALAVELPLIRKSGYDLEHVQAVDMFPHTGHIETVVVLRRAG
jgi:23S rRNA (uracil1939-C5)-methyltransferase